MRRALEISDMIKKIQKGEIPMPSEEDLAAMLKEMDELQRKINA